MLSYKTRNSIRAVGADDNIGLFLYLRQGVGDGNGRVGHAEHRQVVEIVAENHQAVGAGMTLQRAHRRRLVDLVGEDFDEAETGVIGVTIIGNLASRQCVQALGDAGGDIGVTHGKLEDVRGGTVGTRDGIEMDAL